MLGSVVKIMNYGKKKMKFFKPLEICAICSEDVKGFVVFVNHVS